MCSVFFGYTYTKTKRGGVPNPTHGFISYNLTGFNCMKAAWIRDLCKVTSADFICIQEHFKKSSSVNSLFKEQFPEYAPFIIPAYRDKCQDSGRAIGGLAELSKRKYNVNHTQLSSKSFRVQAQLLSFPSTWLLWVNTYFPNDPLTIQFNDEELLEVLIELEDIFERN